MKGRDLRSPPKMMKGMEYLQARSQRVLRRLVLRQPLLGQGQLLRVMETDRHPAGPHPMRQPEMQLEMALEPLLMWGLPLVIPAQLTLANLDRLRLVVTPDHLLALTFLPPILVRVQPLPMLSRLLRDPQMPDPDPVVTLD